MYAPFLNGKILYIFFKSSVNEMCLVEKRSCDLRNVSRETFF